MLPLPLLLLAAAAADAPETLFACSFGTRRVEVVRAGERLTYRFGRADRAELELGGDPASGTVFYHRTLYARGEDQTLRFVNGRHSYVVFNAFQTPDYRQEGAVDQSGLLVLRGGRVVRRLNCRSGGEFLEHPLFERLPQDAENRVPRQ